MDSSEFDEFYTATYARVVTQVYAMVGNRDEAEECVQEAYVRAWAHRGKLSSAEHPEAWVRTTAYRLAVSRWRRVVRGRRPADRAVAAPVVAPAPSEAHVALIAALRQLPEAQRRAIVLHHLADLSVADVAGETGVPEGTVKARLSRGRAALAALLADSPALPEARHA
jgi:RNA polymerase sigma-70 factor (ECF subfamily)